MYQDVAQGRLHPRTIAALLILVAVFLIASELFIPATNLYFGFPWQEGLTSPFNVISTILALIFAGVLLHSALSLITRRQFASSFYFVWWLQIAFVVLAIYSQLHHRA